MNNLSSGSTGSSGSSGMILVAGGIGLLLMCCCSCVSSLIAYEKNWMGLQDMLGTAEDAEAEVYDAPAEDAAAAVDPASGLCEAGKYTNRVNPVPAGKAAKWVCPANWWTTGDSSDAKFACAQTQDCADKRNTWAKDNGKNPAAPYFMSAAEYDLIKSTGDKQTATWVTGDCKWDVRKKFGNAWYCDNGKWDSGADTGHEAAYEKRQCTPSLDCARSMNSYIHQRGRKPKNGVYKSTGGQPRA